MLEPENAELLQPVSNIQSNTKHIQNLLSLTNKNSSYFYLIRREID